MDEFYLSIKSSLIEYKHYIAMGNCVWLYMWLLDRVTKIDADGFGVVWGGKPVKLEDFKGNLELKKRTYARYVNQLEEAGYISTTRTPYGLTFKVAKAKKFFGNTEKNAKKRYANSGTSPYDKSGTSRTKFGTSQDKSGTSNKTIHLDNTLRQLGDEKNKTQNSKEGYEKYQEMKRKVLGGKVNV